MPNIFGLPYSADSGALKVPEWLYVRDGLKRNLETLTRNNRRQPNVVASNHLLVRVLQSITVSQSHPLERYYSLVDGMSLNLATTFRMTSPINKGNLFEGPFYGPGSNEIIVAHNTDFDFNVADKNWQNLQPVQLLRHPFSDLNLGIPDGTKYGTEEGLSVVLVNITMLAVMYRAFRNNEQAILGDGESQRSVMHFVRMYVLPNMLYTHLDLALFNRIDKLSRGDSMGDSNFRHPFYLTDYSARANYIQENLLEKLQRVPKDFPGILRTVPAVTQDTMEGAMDLPDLPPTRQVSWALLVSRLNMILFLYRVCGQRLSAGNRQEINKIRRDILALRTEQAIKDVLPISVYYEVEKELGIVMREQ